MSDVPKLKPCPRGHTNVAVTRSHPQPVGGVRITEYLVWCRYCEWFGPPSDTEAEAIAAWNTRHDPHAEQFLALWEAAEKLSRAKFNVSLDDGKLDFPELIELKEALTALRGADNVEATGERIEADLRARCERYEKALFQIESNVMYDNPDALGRIIKIAREALHPIGSAEKNK